MARSKNVRCRANEVAYFSSLRLPEGKSGDFEIKHSIEKKGTKLTCVSIRDSLFWSVMGKETKTSVYYCEDDVLIHKLLEKGGVWMSDCPQEILSQRWQIERFSGDVIVGGLGLGWAVTELEENPNVKSITVVERSSDVIKLVWSHLTLSKTKLVEGDLYDYLRECKRKGRKFDYGFYDIWCPTGERVLDEHIIPLRKLSEGIIKQENLECWQELTMLGQIKMSLMTMINLWNNPMPQCDWQSLPMPEIRKRKRFFSERYAFIHWMKEAKPSQEEAVKMADNYARTFSNRKLWNKTWRKWDK